MAKTSLPPTNSSFKTCKTCHVSKPATAFRQWQRACRNCFNKWQREQRAPRLKSRDEQNARWLHAYIAAIPSEYPDPQPDIEQWRPVLGYTGRYEVSNWGRVRSLWVRGRTTEKVRSTPLVLKPNVAGRYATVALGSGGIITTRSVHGLVATAFRGERPGSEYVCGHRDGNPFNNHLVNLEWITYEENEADKRRHGRDLAGERNHQAKLTQLEVNRLRALSATGNYKNTELAHMFHLSKTQVGDILKGHSWRV